MTDVSTAQQATEARALAHTVERGHTYLLKGDRNHVVLLLNLYADLLLAAAEQRAEIDALKADILYMAREAGNEMPPEEALAKLRAARIESEDV